MNIHTIDSTVQITMSAFKLKALAIIISILLIIGSILVSTYYTQSNIEAMKIAELNEYNARRAGDRKMALGNKTAQGIRERARARLRANQYRK